MEDGSHPGNHCFVIKDLEEQNQFLREQMPNA
jgi:hypothetical protein